MVTNPYAIKHKTTTNAATTAATNNTSNTTSTFNHSVPHVHHRNGTEITTGGTTTVGVSSSSLLPRNGNTTTTTNTIGTVNHPPQPLSLHAAAVPHEVLIVPDVTVVPKYTTFSQAFATEEEEEDHHHHDDGTDSVPMNHQTTDMATTNTTSTTTNLSNNNNNNNENHNHINNTTTGTSTTTTTTSSAFTTDRDYHVLQQQPHVLYVSTKQHGNPILQHIRNVPFTYSRMVPDYIFSNTSCAIYLSCKYHILYRNYIQARIAALKTDFTCRILLLYMDMDDTEKVLHEMNLLCVTHNFTLILGWSELEMARYIETFKVLQNRDASTIQKSKEGGMNHHHTMVDQMVDVLLSTSRKGTKLNKTDAATLLTQFTCMQQIVQATPDELSMIAGLGPTKVQGIYDTFHQPFSTKLSKERASRNAKRREETTSPLTNDK